LGPGLLLPGPGPIIPPGLFINNDGFCYGYLDPAGVLMPVIWEFSVDPLSVGLAGTSVALEAAGGLGGPGDHPADIYASPAGSGVNFLSFDGDGVANPLLGPAIGLIEPVGTPGDDVDGYDSRILSGDITTIYFTVDPFSLGVAPLADPSDIYVSPIPPLGPYDIAPSAFLYAPAIALGLIPGVDNVDALVVVENGDGVFAPPGIGLAPDVIYFSLAPGSASLGAAGPYFGASPADILFADSSGAAGVYALAGTLGLAGSDNLDALDARFVAVPEPTVLALFGLGLLALLRRRRNLRS